MIFKIRFWFIKIDVVIGVDVENLNINVFCLMNEIFVYFVFSFKLWIVFLWDMDMVRLYINMLKKMFMYKMVIILWMRWREISVFI